MAIKAPGFRILVRPDTVESLAKKAKETATESGIVLPVFVEESLENEALREQSGVDQGIVLEVGPIAFKAYGDVPWCEVGDYIAYARNAGKWIKDPYTNEKLLVINDEDVVCVFKKES